MSIAEERIDSWIEALLARHTAPFSTPEFLKAVRALSARYVESRQTLDSRSPLDSAGKRAAFAAFYAPLHFFTASQVFSTLAHHFPTTELIVDLGCGTGVVGAAWAACSSTQATLVGIDRNQWALAEARWNWATLGLRGRTTRAELDVPVRSLVPDAYRKSLRGVGLVLGWAVNELPPARRDLLRDELFELSRAGASVIVLEPLARSATPWWSSWAERVAAVGGRADEWKFDVNWPARLAALDEAAGFRRESFGVKTLCLPGSS